MAGTQQGGTSKPVDFSSIGGTPVASGGVDFSSIGGTKVDQGDQKPLSVEQIKQLLPGATDTLLNSVYANPEKYRTILSNAASKQPAGYLSTLGEDLKAFLTPSGVSPYPGMDEDAKTKLATDAQAADASRKAAGYSTAYRVIAPVGETLGVNAGGMERAAKEGDVGGVLAHATVPAATALLAGAHAIAAPEAAAAAGEGEAAASHGLKEEEVPVVDAATDQLQKRAAIAEKHAPAPTPEPEPTTQPTTQGPQYAYRARDIGEDGIPSESHSQATVSEDEARGYLESRGNLTGRPQELVRVDLNDAPHQRMTGPNGNDWIKFTKDVPEEKVDTLPDTPAAEEEEPTPASQPAQQTTPAATAAPTAQPATPAPAQPTTGAAQAAPPSAPQSASTPPRAAALPPGVSLPARTAAAITPSIADALSGKSALRVLADHVAPIEPYSGITRAVKPGTNLTGWGNALRDATPDLLNAERDETGALANPTKDLASFADNINRAKKSVWAEYKALLGPNADAAVDATDIAQKMKDSIPARYRLQNPKAAEALDAVADTYNRPNGFTVDELEDFLQNANNDLHSYYAKNKVSRNVAAKDPSISTTLAESDAIRDTLYAKIQELTGKDAAAIKKRYGALSTLEEPTLKRQNVWARQQPDALHEQINKVQGAAKVGKSILNLDLGDAAEGMGQIVGSKFLKERGNSDILVKNAFDELRAKQSPSTPAPAAPSTTVAQKAAAAAPAAGIASLLAASGLRYNPTTGTLDRINP